jgi:hypothetical protein
MIGFIQMDCEDTNSATRIEVGSNPGASYITGGDVKLRLCFVKLEDQNTGIQLWSKNKYYSYGLLRVSSPMPAGSVDITRYFDNEDTGNTNLLNVWGVNCGPNDNELAPTLVSNNTTLHFLYFPKDAVNGKT